MQGPSALGASARSVIAPGWGQLAIGHRLLGGVLLTLSALGVGAVGIALWRVGPVGLVAVAVDPTVLAALGAANLVVAGTRLAATTHAWWSAGGRPLAVGLVVLAAVTVLPHIWAAATLSSAHRAVLAVFPTTPVASPPTTTPAAPSATTSTTVEVGDDGPLPGRVTVLLAGSDAGPGRTGVRTDTVIVATLDPTTGDAALFGLPRNLAGLETPDGTPLPGILNEVYGRASRDALPGDEVAAGMEALRAVAGHLIDLPIDHWALVDLTGFGALVDALGGVTIAVAKDLDAPVWDPATGSHTMVAIPAGIQRLDGDLALGYVRSRTGATDYDRMGRQRCLLGALAVQATPAGVLLRLPLLLDAAADHFATDIPADRLAELVGLAATVDPDRLLVVGFDPAWAIGRTPDGYPIANLPAIRTAVFQATVDLDLAREVSGIPSAAESC